MQLLWVLLFAILAFSLAAVGAGNVAYEINHSAPNVEICNPYCNWATPTPLWPGG